MSEYRGSTTNDLDRINLKTLRKKTIMSVVTEPTPSENTLGDKIERDGKLYECVFNGTDYSWREIAFGIISVASLPLDNISDTAFYRVLNTNSGEYEIYCYNPDESKWCKINNKSIEYIDDLSTIQNPKKDYFYAKETYKFIRNDVEIDNSAFKGYTSSDGYAITISSDKCTITNTSTQSVVFEELWVNITDEKTATLMNDGCLIEDSNILNLGKHYTAYEFFRVAENTYCSKDEISKTTKYTFYYNPTETPTLESFIKLSTNEGSGGSVNIDGVTIEENTSGELQSNSIISVSALPTSEIKTKSLYQLTETITYEEEGVSKNFTMSKLFKHTDGAWCSVSRIYLSALLYDLLTDAQKTDGTLYIVSDDNNPQITWNYSALSGKPIINGITIDGQLTLEDLQLYSRNEVNNLLAQKGNALFVDELPTEMQPLYWYYSKKRQDGTPVADGKRALYIKDNNGTVQYMGITGDVDLSNYYTIEQANATFIPKTSLKTVIDDTAQDTDVISGKAILDMYKDVKIEDITSKISKSTIFTTVSFNAIKIGEHFLYLKFQLTKSGTMAAGSEIALTLNGLENVGIRNTESVAGSLYVSAGAASTFYNKNSKTVYVYAYAEMKNPSMHFSYLIPINL